MVFALSFLIISYLQVLSSKFIKSNHCCFSIYSFHAFFMPLSCRNSSDQQKNNGDWLRQSLSAPCLLPVRALAEFNQTRGDWPTYWLKPDCVQTEDLVSSLKLLSPGICIDGIAACCSSVILVRNNSFPLYYSRHRWLYIFPFHTGTHQGRRETEQGNNLYIISH